MGASHSVEATDTTMESTIDTIETIVEEPEDSEPEDDLELSMDWFWPFV
jgi:hypothetical protein